MRKRWKILGGLAGTALVAAAAPIVYIESQCDAPVAGLRTDGYRALLSGPDTRPEGRTWLTYPEWHIVYSADSLGRHLQQDKRPSAYPYLADVAAFWRSTCALNRVAGDADGAGEAKVMIYTIGLSFAAEMLVKSAWENTIGRSFEALSGWTSADDRHAAAVQADYGRFMHQTPWYAYPFGRALSGLWDTVEPAQTARHWERRVALSLEYGVKAGYAKLIGWASGSALGADETRMRLLVRGDPEEIAVAGEDMRISPRAGGMLRVDAPRYERFTSLARHLASTDAEIVEIAGNDDLFVTFQSDTEGAASLPRGMRLVDMALGDRPGWRRVGVSIKAQDLLPTIRRLRTSHAELEHVYDY